MKERTKKVSIVAGVMLVVLAVLLFWQTSLHVIVRKNKNSLGVGATEFNLVDSLTFAATTTNPSDPVKLVARNYNRIYCAFVNDSDTAVYLWPQNFGSSAAARAGVSATGGIRLNSSGGSYELLPENMVITDVWATSTASSKQINVACQ